MRRRKDTCFAIFLVLVFILLPFESFAEKRSIFVGDLVEIKITAKQFTEEDLREKFGEFEIVDIKTEKDGYVIPLRSFERGERIVALGDKEIIITVK